MSTQPDWQPMETAPKNGQEVLLRVAIRLREGDAKPAGFLEVVAAADEHCEDLWLIDSRLSPRGTKYLKPIAWAPMEGTA